VTGEGAGGTEGLVGERITALGEVPGDDRTGNARCAVYGVLGRACLGGSGFDGGLVVGSWGRVTAGLLTVTGVGLTTGVSGASSSSLSLTITVGGGFVDLTKGAVLRPCGLGVPLDRPFSLDVERFGAAGGRIGPVENRGAGEGAEAVLVGCGWYDWRFGTGTGVSTRDRGGGVGCPELAGLGDDAMLDGMSWWP
jgi:hypothetical protein